MAAMKSKFIPNISRRSVEKLTADGTLDLHRNSFVFNSGDAGPTASTVRSQLLSNYARWSAMMPLFFLCSHLHGASIINSYAFASASTLNDNLTLFLALEEAIGTRFNSTGSGEDFTDNNAVGQTTGIIGNAALFDRLSNQSLSHADTANLSVGNEDFTVAAWCNPSTVLNDMVIMSHYITTGNQRSWRLWYNSALGKFQFTCSSTGTDANELTATTFGTVSAGAWYFVVAWHDAAANMMSIQVNDGTVDTVAYALGVHDSTGDFVIGARSASNFFDGNIDEVAMWKRVLIPAERTLLYGSGAAKFCCPYGP